MLTNKRPLMIAVAIYTFLLLSGCNSFRMAPVDGVVIDAKTEKPIEGALIVSEWLTIYGIHGNHHTDIQVFDTRTDKDGKFTLPEWSQFKTLHTSAPFVSAYHDGYRLAVVPYGTYKRHYPDKQLIIKMDKSSEEDIWGDKKRSLKQLGDIIYNRRDIPCFWERLPILTRQLIEGKNSLDRAGIKNHLAPATGYKRACPTSNISIEDS